MRIHNRGTLRAIRKKLRQKQTPAEKIFWEHVRNRKLHGLKFIRQHSICNYVVDFYCASYLLVIELDGGIHDTEEQNNKDKIRDENLTELGFRILRFRNERILYELDHVKEMIMNAIQTDAPSPPAPLLDRQRGD